MLKDDLRTITTKEAVNLGQQFYYGKLGSDFTEEMRRSVKVILNEWLKKE
ncbi:MAG: hypothetical protein ACFE96_11870 [Candidatus Hermodarchaeota archaeon]